MKLFTWRLILTTWKWEIAFHNFNNECFAWAVISPSYPVEKNNDRVRKYFNSETVLNLNNLKFPMKLSQMAKFEKLNKISVHVYVSESLKQYIQIAPVLIRNLKLDRLVNLLFSQDN